MLFALLLISLLTSVLFFMANMDGAVMVFKMIVAYLLTVIVWSESYSSLEAMNKAFLCWIYSGVVIVIIGLFVWGLAISTGIVIDGFVYQQRTGFRAVSTLPDPNRFGSFAAMLAVVLLVHVLLSERKLRWSILGTIVTIGVFASGSRGALLAVGAGVLGGGGAAIFAMGKTVVWKFAKRATLLIVVVGIGLSVLMYYTPNYNVLSRFSGNAVSEGDSVQDNARLDLVYLVWNEMVESPSAMLFGTQDYGRLDNDKEGGASPHNTYLTVVAAQGLVGLTIFLIFLAIAIGRGVWMARRYFRHDRKLAVIQLSLVAGLITVLVHGFAIALYTTGFFWIYLGLYLGVVTLKLPAPLACARSVSA
jgi:hypothetical protein